VDAAGYIGAMIVAAVIRNLDDLTGLIGMSQRRSTTSGRWRWRCSW
jgi:hypothetical protein